MPWPRRPAAAAGTAATGQYCRKTRPPSPGAGVCLHPHPLWLAALLTRPCHICIPATQLQTADPDPAPALDDPFVPDATNQSTPALPPDPPTMAPTFSPTPSPTMAPTPHPPVFVSTFFNLTVSFPKPPPPELLPGAAWNENPQAQSVIKVSPAMKRKEWEGRERGGKERNQHTPLSSFLPPHLPTHRTP